ncbi:putative glutamine-transport transmembrane protein ABC transporter [Mycobacterium kansasii]|uniref:Putative glutamine-transport transmembrane protein ABC transporter n=1 Tax=Mycobacterium kansasii TaxID=1768 RepID=A0A1V3X9Y1_MYCKA|nr:putative glutamine-transport transmembrane protein ABC transporter [Mycobacterium kansasii]
MAVSSTLGRRLGDTLQVGAHTLRIVGIVPNSTALAKIPNIFLTTEGLQQLAYNGQPMVTSIGVDGAPGTSRTATRPTIARARSTTWYGPCGLR